MQIYGPSQVHGAQSISGPHTNLRSNAVGSTSSSAAGADELQLSAAGQLASQLNDVPDIRQDRVNALRAAIQSGTYETSDRLSGALDRLLDEIG